jgi:hypothetical protein
MIVLGELIEDVRSDRPRGLMSGMLQIPVHRVHVVEHGNETEVAGAGTVAQILGDRPFTDPVDLSRESIESVDDALDASCIGVLVLEQYGVPDTHLAASAHASGSSGMTVKAGCFNAILMKLMCE